VLFLVVPLVVTVEAAAEMLVTKSCSTSDRISKFAMDENGFVIILT
jgi:hypothetical protein